MSWLDDQLTSNINYKHRAGQPDAQTPIRRALREWPLFANLRDCIAIGLGSPSSPSPLLALGTKPCRR